MYHLDGPPSGAAPLAQHNNLITKSCFLTLLQVLEEKNTKVHTVRPDGASRAGMHLMEILWKVVRVLQGIMSQEHLIKFKVLSWQRFECLRALQLCMAGNPHKQGSYKEMMFLRICRYSQHPK